jgi:acyl-CoA thioester hydrolase
MKKNELTVLKEINVRFSEVDAMGFVWHGSYAKYFEDGREEFGRQFDLGYLDIFNSGYYAPLISLDFQFKKPLGYNNKALVRTTYIHSPASKIIFAYEITSPGDNSIIATGSSTQVFLNKLYELVLYNPDFYINWKKKYGVQ